MVFQWWVSQHSHISKSWRKSSTTDHYIQDCLGALGIYVKDPYFQKNEEARI